MAQLVVQREAALGAGCRAALGCHRGQFRAGGRLGERICCACSPDDADDANAAPGRFIGAIAPTAGPARQVVRQERHHPHRRPVRDRDRRPRWRWPATASTMPRSGSSRTKARAISSRPAMPRRRPRPAPGPDRCRWFWKTTRGAPKRRATSAPRIARPMPSHAVSRSTSPTRWRRKRRCAAPLPLWMPIGRGSQVIGSSVAVRPWRGRAPRHTATCRWGPQSMRLLRRGLQPGLRPHPIRRGSGGDHSRNLRNRGARTCRA